MHFAPLRMTIFTYSYFEMDTSRAIRINAFLASAGLGSRRSVEKLILEGKITVNGQVVRNLALRVDAQKDRVFCENKPVVPLEFQYVMFHKPRGCGCTRHDPHGAKTIYDVLPSQLRHLAHAGRLDVDSEGLLLLSNDGAWVAQITHPRHGVKKIYEVEVEGAPNKDSLSRALGGVQSGSELLKAESAEVMKCFRGKSWLKVSLAEGRNREIRRIFGALKHSVIRLKRVAIGNLGLGGLKTGGWRNLTPDEIRLFEGK